MSVKLKVFYGFAAFLTLIIMLLATAPASLLARAAQAANIGVQINGSSGTIWKGHAQKIQLQAAALNDVDWNITVWRLFIGQLYADVQFGGTQAFRGQLTLHANREQQTLTDVDLKIPATTIAEFSPMTGVQLDGDFIVHADSIIVQNTALKSIQGRLQWNKAVVQTPFGQPPLGSYAVNVNTDAGGVIRGDIQDLEGVLDLKGQVQLQNNTVTLDVNSRSDLPEQLDRFFRAVGRQENGRYVIHWQQPLR